MKIRFQINDRVNVEAEGAGVKELYDELHRLIETFGVSRCGCCKGDDVQPVARKNGKFTFYEFRCLNLKCRAVLSMGVKDDGSIYPRRKYHEDHAEVQAKRAKAGDWLPDGGWAVYRPEGGKVLEGRRRP